MNDLAAECLIRCPCILGLHSAFRAFRKFTYLHVTREGPLSFHPEDNWSKQEYEILDHSVGGVTWVFHELDYMPLPPSVKPWIASKQRTPLLRTGEIVVIQLGGAGLGRRRGPVA